MQVLGISYANSSKVFLFQSSVVSTILMWSVYLEYSKVVPPCNQLTVCHDVLRLQVCPQAPPCLTPHSSQPSVRTQCCGRRR
jgi:hypothetical protein